MNRPQRIVVAATAAVAAVGIALAAGMGLSAASVARPTVFATVTPAPTATWSPPSTAPAPTTTLPAPTTTTTAPPVCVTPTETTQVMAVYVAAAANDDDEKEAVKARLKKWAETLSVDDPKAKEMGALYADKAVLHPTLSPVVRTSRAEIEKYFEEDFLPKKPKLDPDKGVDRKQLEVKGTIAIDSGIYTFTDKDGKVIAVARYVFVYEKTNCGWIIIHHSSSLLPEKK